MKNAKISKILGVGVAVAMLTSLFTVAAPASAGTLSFSAESLTSGAMPRVPTATVVNELAAGSDVSNLAVSADGNTIYAVAPAVAAGATANLTLKSTNGGVSWSILTVTTNASEQARLVAVAPGDTNTVLVVMASNNLFLSNDGGTTFSQLTPSATPMTTINAVAISPLTAGTRYITLAGVSAGTSDIQYLSIGSLVSTWTSLKTSADWQGTPGGTIAGTSGVFAIEYSPNFASDKVLTAVTNNGAASLFEIYSFSTKKGNTAASFINYPVNFLAVSPTAASIALAPTYLGADETLRIAFVGVATAGGTGGLFRLSNTTATGNLLSAAADIASVDFNGTDLVAGAQDSNAVYYSANPLASAASITITNTTIYQRPGGATNTLVAWAGANVIAGTSGASSAFAVSKDKGATFNDVSLIDTNINTQTDVAVAKDGSTIILIANDGVNTSVWRKTTPWERVLNLPTAIMYIVRMAPDVATNIYIAETGGTNTAMFYSNDNGEKSWVLRSLVDTPVDVAVESAQVLYALTAAGAVSKSSNSGFTWDSAVATGLGNGATIVSLKKDQLVVGGTGGGVAWSVDGNASATTWKVTSTQPFTSGAVQVTGDKIETGGFIYAATSTATQSVKRLNFGGTSWSDIMSGDVVGGARGLALNDGVLYVLSETAATDNKSILTRVLTPTTATSSTIWSSVATSGSAMVRLNRAPQALKASTGKLWAINTITPTNALFSFTDTVYKTAPTVTIPADKSVPQTNPASGNAQDIAFSWAKLSDTTSYKLEISLDSAFTQIVIQPTITPSPATTDPVVALIGPTGAQGVYNFAPDVTYYWRVRATVPLDSPNSPTRSFAFSSLTPFVLTGPAVGATGVSVKPILSWTAYTGAKWYEVTVSEDPTFAIPEWSHNVNGLVYGVVDPLKYSTTYYWRVRGVTADPFVQGTKVITPAGPYQTGAFTTEAAPVTTTPEPIVIISTAPAPPAQVITVPVVQPAQPQAIPNWMLMTIIVIGAILVVALIILIVRTRRVA